MAMLKFSEIRKDYKTKITTQESIFVELKNIKLDKTLSREYDDSKYSQQLLLRVKDWLDFFYQNVSNIDKVLADESKLNTSALPEDIRELQNNYIQILNTTKDQNNIMIDRINSKLADRIAKLDKNIERLDLNTVFREENPPIEQYLVNLSESYEANLRKQINDIKSEIEYLAREEKRHLRRIMVRENLGNYSDESVAYEIVFLKDLSDCIMRYDYYLYESASNLIKYCILHETQMQKSLRDEYISLLNEIKANVKKIHLKISNLLGSRLEEVQILMDMKQIQPYMSSGYSDNISYLKKIIDQWDFTPKKTDDEIFQWKEFIIEWNDFCEAEMLLTQPKNDLSPSMLSEKDIHQINTIKQLLNELNEKINHS